MVVELCYWEIKVRYSVWICQYVVQTNLVNWHPLFVMVVSMIMIHAISLVVGIGLEILMDRRQSYCGV